MTTSSSTNIARSRRDLASSCCALGCAVLASASLAGLAGCSASSASADRGGPPAPSHRLEMVNATAFNTITPHSLASGDIIAPVGFAGLDAGWFAIIVADEIRVNGRAIEPSPGSDRCAIAVWGLNLDDPAARGDADRPWQWHYTNSVFWLTDTRAIAALRDVGIDARPASIDAPQLAPALELAAGAGDDPSFVEPLAAATIVAEGFTARAAIDNPDAPDTPLAPFDRDAVHWSRSGMGQGIGSAAYHGHSGSRLAGRVVFEDVRDAQLGAAFPAEASFVSTHIERVNLTFTSILPGRARLGLAAVPID